jgi:hypothetical protein
MNDFSKPEYHTEKLALLQGDAQFVEKLSKPRLSVQETIEKTIRRHQKDLKRREDQLALVIKKSKMSTR